LLTLLGPGGVGKTRLALEFARLHAAEYSDGVWLVELRGIDDAAHVPAAIAGALGLELDSSSEGVTARLSEYLGVRRVLLILDNCEHLVGACADVVSDLLRTCPNVRVLATSREALAMSGEVRWNVPPIDPHSDAVRLFIERAHAVNNSLRLTQEDLTAIARMCVRLEGMPLAVEYVAAQVRVLTVRQLADRLEDDRALMETPIGAAIHRSCQLLSPEQRTLLQRLSVFAGSWTLSLAELECAGSGIESRRILDLLTGLVDRSMVLVETTGAEARYRLAPLVRVYAREHLADSGDVPVERASDAADPFAEDGARAARARNGFERTQVRPVG